MREHDRDWWNQRLILFLLIIIFIGYGAGTIARILL